MQRASSGNRRTQTRCSRSLRYAVAGLTILCVGLGPVDLASAATPTFDAPEALNTNATTDVFGDSNPQVTSDGAGNWVAVWSSLDDLVRLM